MSDKRKHLINIILLIVIIVIAIAILGVILGAFSYNLHDKKENETQMENLQTNESNMVETYNVTNSNEISKYIPKNIKEITIINYLSDKDNPATLNLKQIDKIKEYTDLLFKTNWDIIEKSEIINLIDGEYYKVKIIGDTELVLNMKYLKTNYVGVVNIEDTYYSINSNAYNEMIDYGNKKYYLHKSDLPKPSKEECIQAQKNALKDLSDSEKQRIKERIENIHSVLEIDLVEGVSVLKNSTSPYWEQATTFGVFTDPFTGVKIEKGGNFLYVLNELKKIKDISNDIKTKSDLNKAYNLLKDGIDNHNLDNCFESHKIIHDYDYWAINYPVSLKYDPVDWGGVYTYFGNI